MISNFARALNLLTTASFLLMLGACKLSGQPKRSTLEADDSVLVSYFFSDQYAVKDTNVRDFLTLFYGAVAAASPQGKMDLWTNPPSGCYLSSSFVSVASQSVGLRRLLDIGGLQMETAPSTLTDLKKNAGNTYFFFDALVPGTYRLHSPGLKFGALAFDQSFDVLEKGGGIKVYTFPTDGSTTAPIQETVASPEIPASTDPSYRVWFNRMSDNAVSFQAPPKTDYVRVRLRDGSNTSGGDVTCFTKPNTSLLIPQGTLYSFRTGQQGYMELDFVTSSEITDVAKLKRGTIVSTMRHFQGTFEYVDSNGVKMTANAGLIEFR